MIAPNMATMLGFLTTDARIEPALLQRALSRAVHRTFNRTTVDGDTSTNDMVLALASGAGAVEIGEGALEDFTEAIEAVCLRLAKAVARDGEGATKLVEVRVTGAASEEDAERVARTIAESPLVKTALFGADPNWGRLMMAAGRSGVRFDPSRVRASVGPHLVFRNGTGEPFDHAAAHAYLKLEEVCVAVDLGAGEASVRFWTCDFSYDYVRINAEYHT